MRVYEAVIALMVTSFFLGGLVPAPLNIASSLFFSASALHLLLNLVILGFYGKILEDGMGARWFATIYLCGAVWGILFSGVSVGGFQASMAPGASAGLMALLGTIVALRPLAWVVADFFPVPAFVAAGFFIIVRLILEQNLDIMPLLLGIAFGYPINESKQQPAPAGRGPPRA